MKLAIGIVIVGASLRVAGLISIVQCPPALEKEIMEYNELKSSEVSCTMQLICPTSEDGSSSCKEELNCPSDGKENCKVKLKIDPIKNFDSKTEESSEENTKRNLCAKENIDDMLLLPHPDNCSLFYKCDWGSPVLFECPEDLHFNSLLQVCDWPWQAGCDPSWLGCPRPFPHCPKHYPKPLLLPHPTSCDCFYQCNWGKPQIRACPVGLHFNPLLKICDWPYNSNCLVC